MATTDGCIPANSSDSNPFQWLSLDNGLTETGSTPFSSSAEHTDHTSKAVLTAMQTVIYVGVLPALVMIGVITNVINLVIFARQGLADRINMCLFRYVTSLLLNQPTDRWIRVQRMQHGKLLRSAALVLLESCLGLLLPAARRGNRFQYYGVESDRLNCGDILYYICAWFHIH